MSLKEELAAHIRQSSEPPKYQIRLEVPVPPYDSNIERFRNLEEHLFSLRDEYVEALELAPTLIEIKDVLDENYTDVSTFKASLEKSEERFKKILPGRETVSASIGFKFGTEPSASEDQEVRHFFYVEFTFILRNNRSEIDDSQVKLTVAHRSNLPTNPAYKYLWVKGTQPDAIFLPHYSQITEEMKVLVNNQFVKNFKHPVRGVIRSISAPGTEPPYTQPGIDFRDAPALAQKYKDKNFDNPFVGSTFRAGELSYELGNLTRQRYGIEDKLAQFPATDKEVVETKPDLNDIYLTAVRWDIGQFRDYAGKEVIVVVKPDEEALQAARENHAETIHCTVFIVAAKQQTLRVTIPIFDQKTTAALRSFDQDKKKISQALNEALANPRKATVISARNVNSSLAYARPIFSDVKKKTIETKPQSQTTYTSRNVDDDDDNDVDERIELAERQRQIDDEEEEALWDEDCNSQISIGEAHGEVTWNEGSGTDEDGCDVYSSD